MHLLGLCIVEESKGIASNARRAGLEQVQCRGHRDSCVGRVSAGLQNTRPNSTGQGLTGCAYAYDTQQVYFKQDLKILTYIMDSYNAYKSAPFRLRTGDR